MTRRAMLAALAALVLLSGAGSALAAASGGTRNELYRMHEADAEVTASVQLDRVLFALATVGGKYRIFILRLEARGDRPDLALSRTADRIVALVDGREVPALLDPAAADPALWEGLDPALRQALLYPAAVEAGTMRQLYLLLPAADVPGLPSGFRLTIGALGRTLELTRSAPMAD
jgi:hypothetical protein